MNALDLRKYESVADRIHRALNDVERRTGRRPETVIVHGYDEHQLYRELQAQVRYTGDVPATRDRRQIHWMGVEVIGV